MLTPYLHFQGTCRAAMTRYQEILGGDLTLSLFSEMPDAPDAWANSDRVLHAQLNTPTHGPIMGSDFPPDTPGDPQKAVSVAIDVASAETGHALFQAFLVGGDVTIDFAPNFFSPGFGMCRDRFGTHWMVSTTPDSAPNSG